MFGSVLNTRLPSTEVYHSSEILSKVYEALLWLVMMYISKKWKHKIETFVLTITK